jgi:hypothetical protein
MNEEGAQNAKVQDDAVVHWTAREYVPTDKNALWYVSVIIVAVVFIALDVFYTKSYTFSALVVVMAVALMIYSSRPPRAIQYTLSGHQGLYIGEKLRPLSQFKAFGLIDEGGNHSIILLPIKRFSPGVSVYFPAEAGEKIVDILGKRLPMEKMKLDFLDVIVRRLRL